MQDLSQKRLDRPVLQRVPHAAQALPTDLLAAIFAQLGPVDRCLCRQQQRALHPKAQPLIVFLTQSRARCRQQGPTHHTSVGGLAGSAPETQQRIQLVPALKCSRTLVPCWCRAATAAVCLEWAAVHADSRIWEAVSVDCERAHGLRQRGKRTAECLHRWLSARALGLRQLEFCNHCSCLRAGSREEMRDNVSLLPCRW